MLVDCGKRISIDVATDKLPQAALDHVVKIGLKNLLQDAHAGIKDVAKAREKSEAKLAALMRGEVRTASPIRSFDPQAKQRLMRAIAEVWETNLEVLAKLPAAKRDKEARRLAEAKLAAPPVKGKKAA